MSILGKFVSNLPCCVSSSQSREMVSVERELTLLLQVPGAVVRTSRGHYSRAVFHQSWHTHCRRSIWLSARWVSVYVQINVTSEVRWWHVRRVWSLPGSCVQWGVQKRHQYLVSGDCLCLRHQEVM